MDDGSVMLNTALHTLQPGKHYTDFQTTAFLDVDSCFYDNAGNRQYMMLPTDTCVDILGIVIVSSSLTFHCIFLVQVCVLSCLLTIT